MFHIFFGTTKSFLYVFNIYITYINKSNKTLLLIFRPLIFPPLHQNIRIASPFGRRGSMVRQVAALSAFGQRKGGRRGWAFNERSEEGKMWSLWWFIGDFMVILWMFSRGLYSGVEWGLNVGFYQ